MHSTRRTLKRQYKNLRIARLIGCNNVHHKRGRSSLVSKNLEPIYYLRSSVRLLMCTDSNPGSPLDRLRKHLLRLLLLRAYRFAVIFHVKSLILCETLPTTHFPTRNDGLALLRSTFVM